MSTIEIKLTYTHTHLRQVEETTLSGMLTNNEETSKAFREALNTLQTAFTTKAMTAMKIGNNFFIFAERCKDKFLTINIPRLWQNQAYMARYTQRIQTFIKDDILAAQRRPYLFRPNDDIRVSPSQPTAHTTHSRTY